MNLASIGAYFAANWIELAGFLTTWIGIWLTTKRLLICWPVILAADIFYLVVFYQARLYSDALLQVFFIAFTLYGWWHWWRGIRQQGAVLVVPLRVRGWIMGLVAGAIGAWLLGSLMVRLGAALPRLDAALTSYSLVASWWQARKHTANWILWIAIDGVYIGEYAYKNLWLTAVLSVGLVALAVLGLRDWQRAAAARSGSRVAVLRNHSRQVDPTPRSGDPGES
jgi:nicotinamide mononucleotide transporter